MFANMGYSFVFFFLALLTSTYATSIEVLNNCDYPVWAAATPVGGGRRLDKGQTWTINPPPGTEMARVWGRTKCNFDGAGKGTCETGDCGGVLQCTAWGKPPNTLFEYALNKFGNLDYPDISLVDGFNIPMSFTPTKPGNPDGKCRRVECTANIVGECPDPLKVPGGCNNPCTTFNEQKYCCNDQNAPCNPTDYSKFFKERCPDAYSFPKDDPTSTFPCRSDSTDYKVVFCP